MQDAGFQTKCSCITYRNCYFSLAYSYAFEIFFSVYLQKLWNAGKHYILHIHSKKGIFPFSHTLRPGFISRKNYRNWKWDWELSKTVAGMIGFVWLVIGVLWKFRGNDYTVKWKFIMIIKKLQQSHSFYIGIMRKNISKN